MHLLDNRHQLHLMFSVFNVIGYNVICDNDNDYDTTDEVWTSV